MSAALRELAPLESDLPRRPHALPRTPSLTNSDSTTPDSDDVGEPRFPLAKQSTLVVRPNAVNEKLALHASPPPSPAPMTRRAQQKMPQRPRTVSNPLMWRNGLLVIAGHPHVLARMLEWLAWTDFEALSRTSRAMRHLMADVRIKDVVLSNFVPGYRSALRCRDKRYWEDSIRMDYHDLATLMASQETPLHRYPMHALSVLSSESYTQEMYSTTTRLQTLALAHSRAVLLLQAIIHSSSFPIPSDLEDTRWKANNSPQSGLRELTFPAPLSYFGPNAPKKTCSADGGRKSSSIPPADRLGHTRKWASESSAAPPPLKMRSNSKRMSFFAGNAVRPPPPPPPSSELTSHRFYSGTWRPNWRGSMAVSDDEPVLRPPKRRFLASSFSSQSSLGSAPTRGSSQPVLTPLSSSPHDLLAATARNRAPILRVFVPCSVLSVDVLTACEDQLIEDGLWDHMSVGDIVCNFGYVPPIDEWENDSPSQSPQDTDRRTWLIFTGDQLVIYDPKHPAPIGDALSLPSPLYYAHILSANANPHFYLSLPAMKAHYTLAPVTTTVPSPRSYNGIVRLRTYAWLATVDAGMHAAMSDGWRGEWVLQGEGTREGKMALAEILRGSRYGVSEHEWEVVRESSGEGRLWLRLIPPRTALYGASASSAGSIKGPSSTDAARTSAERALRT